MTKKSNIISYFRTGTHWLVYSLQEYLDTKINTKDGNQKISDAEISHSHDRNLQEEYDNIIYLWRDPVDVMFSTIVFIRTEEWLGRVEPLIRPLTRYARHYRRWTTMPCKKRLIISYEDLELNYQKTLRDVLLFLGREPDTEKIEEIRKIVTKGHIHNQVRKSIIPLDKEYEKKKQTFRKVYGDMIYKVFDTIVKYGY